MGVCNALTEVLYFTTRKSDLNFRLMKISGALQMMQNLHSNKIKAIRNAEDCENEAIEMAFEQEAGCLEDDPDYSQEYNEVYQVYLDEKEKTSKKFERLIQDAQDEIQRKEKALELEQEQIETQLEVCEADQEAYQGLAEKNAKNEFSYF